VSGSTTPADADELARTRRELVAAQADLEAAVAAYKAFAYSVSHDLRAPLRAIAGFTGILEENLASEQDGETRQLLGIIRDNAQLLHEQIDGLLVISRLEHRELRPVELDLTALAHEVVDAVRAREPEREIAVYVANLPRVVADRDLLRVAFTELVQNAWKFSRERPAAEVQIGGFTRNGAVEVFVRDNGVGFHPESAERLFVVFRRLHGPQEYEGRGLGLAIVRAAIARHRGRVWAECDPAGPATTMWFSLPV
jgi:light-regulated signal transduction histidine kinase (bacteriophytochrome)